MTAADRVRERKICEAVVRVLEKRLSDTRSDGFSPEEPPHQSRYSDCERVEWIVQIGGSKFAIEVTLVQALSNRIAQAEHLRKLCEPIANRLNGELPGPSTYELVIECGALSDIQNNRLASISGCLEAWIVKVAPTLGMKAPGHFARETPVGVGFEVTLYRFQTRRHHGHLHCAYAMPDNLEQEQLPTVQKALHDKLPKLKRWRDKDAATVLVIETRDVALSDEHRVAELIYTELRSCAVDLDNLFIVDTAVSQWPVYDVRPIGTEGQPWLEEVASFDELDLLEVQ